MSFWRPFVLPWLIGLVHGCVIGFVAGLFVATFFKKENL